MKFNPDKMVGGRTNEQRADAASDSIYHNLEWKRSKNSSEEELIIDLITNLLHLAHREELDYQQIIGAAIMHYEAER